jgi:hypothetical protein
MDSQIRRVLDAGAIALPLNPEVIARARDADHVILGKPGWSRRAIRSTSADMGPVTSRIWIDCQD